MKGCLNNRKRSKKLRNAHGNVDDIFGKAKRPKEIGYMGQTTTAIMSQGLPHNTTIKRM